MSEDYYVVLAGGVGAAKFIEGLVNVVKPELLKIIVNTGDDTELFGLKICPDLDIITYTLANLVDKENNNFVYFTSDKHVIEHGSIFTDFLQSVSNIMVLEDFDFHLNSRKEGNTIMYHLLGLSDGLIQSFNKKIIISTNLSNLNNIDDAIIRKGRCFDILNFRSLLWDEVIEFFKHNNYIEIINKIEEKEYTLADLYYILNNKNNKEIEVQFKKAGFC